MIRIGTAGLMGEPMAGLAKLASAGLDAAEIEFTHGIRMPDETAAMIGERALELGIKLSVHCPYYINLCSADTEIIKASRQRIIQSIEKAKLLKANLAVFHPGFTGKRTKEECHAMVREAITDIQDRAHVKPSMLAPETAGKASQYGGLAELLMLSRETGCSVTIDFAHLLARNGKIDYSCTMQDLSHFSHIHCHYSGIEFGPKGERRHIDFSLQDFQPLAKAILDYGADCTMICESPDTFGGALIIKGALGIRKV